MNSGFQWTHLLEWGSYKRLFERIDRHDLLTLAGAFAFTTALALSPFAIIALTLLALLHWDSQQTLIDQIQDLVGTQAGVAVQEIIQNANQRSEINGLSGFLGLLILLISASAIFSQLRMCFDKINEYKFPSNLSFANFIKERLLSVGLVLGFIFLMVVSLIITTLLVAIFPTGDRWWIDAAVFTVNIISFTIVFSCMFKFIPTKTMPWRRCLISGLVACAFFQIGKSLISFYVGHSAFGSVYGAAGSLIVLLVWIYYSSFTLLLSFEFTNTVVLNSSSDGIRRVQNQTNTVAI